MASAGPLTRNGPASGAHGKSQSLDWALPVGFGSLVMGVAVALYLSGLSRAVGVVIFPLGVVAALAGLVMRRRGTRPGRVWIILYAALVTMLAIYGIWLLIYSAMHPPVVV